VRIRFEELSPAKRAGGIEMATRGLVKALTSRGLSISRSAEEAVYDAAAPPDCVHIHGLWSPSLMAKWWQWRRRGVPAIVSVHGMLEPWAMNHKRWKKLLGWYGYQRHCLNSADALHATSEREAASIRRLNLQPHIETIPWGTDLPSLAPATERNADCRTALFVGRIYPVKGLPLLIDAWAQLRPSGWTLNIIGPDQAGHRGELEARVRSSGLTEEISFIGPLSGDALQKAYETAELFVLPSHTENFGMAAAEALAHGLPVIASQGTPWEVLQRENCGWWPPVSVDGIAAALADATSRSHEQLAEMGRRGRDLVRRDFTWDSVAKQMQEVH
jgi:glycosyltransferase involved in cell wall biosynthesis